VSAAATPSAGEPRCRFIEHKGKRILFHDLANIMDPKEGFPVVELSKSIMVRQPRESVLTLTWVAGSRFNREIVDALRDLVKHNKPYVKAGAIVGLSGLQKVVYITVTQLSGRRLPTFATVEEAKDWLVSQV